MTKLNEPNGQTVYILENDAMPGLVKVGRTGRTVEQRMADLYSTGVPKPFRCVHAVAVDSAAQVEGRLKSALAAYREVDNREFFRISTVQAIAALNLVAEGAPIVDVPPDPLQRSSNNWWSKIRLVALYAFWLGYGVALANGFADLGYPRWLSYGCLIMTALVGAMMYYDTEKRTVLIENRW